MFNNNLPYDYHYEYLNIEENYNEYLGIVLRETFCPMCEEYHTNNSMCQYPLQEAS